MPPETLDYRAVAPATPRRPRRLLSHAVTGATLCVVAMWFDRTLRFDMDEARHLPLIESALVLYGFTFAALAFARGGLTRGDRIVLGVCLALFAFAAFVAVLMPRGIHN